MSKCDILNESSFHANLSAIDTVLRLLVTSEARDTETGVHMFRVGAICAVLAGAAGETMDFCEQVFWASPLHDLGKVGVPDRILQKTGALTDEEWRVMRSHPEIGARILADSKSDILRLASLGAYTHHERFDGSGYPRGISGEDIPMIGRLIAIGDCYDALSMDRCYRSALPWQEVLNFLGRNAGTHFDPKLIEIFNAHSSTFHFLREQINSVATASAVTFAQARLLSRIAYEAYSEVSIKSDNCSRETLLKSSSP